MDALTRQLTERIVEIAQIRRRFGYRRVHNLLRTEFPDINHKRVYDLYRAQGLAVRRRNRRRKLTGVRTPLQAATQLNEVWSMDFVCDQLANGRRLKCLTVADDFSHEAVQIAVDFSMSGQYVTRMLNQVAQFRGYPSAIRMDNGPEFTSRAFMGWARTHGIQHILIQPGRPMQNGYVESFNARFRDECLNEYAFDSLAEARQIIAARRDDYNQVRPHGSIDRMPLVVFAARCRQEWTATQRSTSSTTIQP